MPFTADELVSINNSALENYIDKGKVWTQNVANKPMLKAFNDYAGSFSGGKEYVSFAVKSGQGGGALAGYSGDNQVAYYNPTGIKRARFAWKEHHIGMTVTHTELKTDGVDIDDDAGDKTREMSGREQHALANIFDDKLETLGEDYAESLDELVHGDGTSDTKALAGIQSIVLADPSLGSTGNISRANTYWRNRASTAAAAAASSGSDAITSASTDGGVLLHHLEKEWLQLSKFRNGGTKIRIFAGSDFIAAYKKEIRANGSYSQTGFNKDGVVDGAMGDPTFKGIPLEYDPTLDALSLAKRAYFIDMGKRGVRLLYMDGQRMKKHHPSRPYDRYVMYNGITMTGVMLAKQLNTSMVVDIA